MITPQARPDATAANRLRSVSRRLATVLQHVAGRGMRVRRVPLPALVLTIAVSVVGSGCSSSGNPVAPSGSAIVTIRVVNEAYRILLTTPAQIDAARAAQAGGRASIPNGRLVSGTQVNSGYAWHVEDVAFVEATIEVCDGLPSHVQREGVTFGGGRYCPWGAQVVSVEPVR